MGLRDDLNRTLQDVARGDLGAVIGDAGRIAHGVSGGVVPAFGAQAGMGMNFGQNPNSGFQGAAPGRSASPGVMVPPPPAASQGYTGPCDAQMMSPLPAAESRVAPCCDRYSLSNGFLVDGATGTVWKYETKSNSFEEVPVKREKNKQALVDSLVEAKLSALRGQYEAELMGVTDPKERQKQLAAFEKDQLAPLRMAARSLTF